MKSAAFNLAFKVHRNDLAFPEGLLKAYDDNSHQDFIEALNSLAGEKKYDINAIEQMVDDARKAVDAGEDVPKVDVDSLRDEIEELKTKKKEHTESIHRLQSQNSSMKPSVIPGLNSALLGIVGFVITMIIFLVGIVILGIICLIATFVVIGITLMQDLEAQKKEKETIARKVERNLGEIEQFENLINDIDPILTKKSDLLDTVMQNK